MSPDQSYPAVRFIVRYGLWLSIIIGLAPLLAALVALLYAPSLWIAAALAISAPVVFLLMKGFTELVAIISDMLLPK